MATRAEIQDAINRAAAAVGLGSNGLVMMKAIANVESGEGQVNTGIATGIKDKGQSKPAASAKGLWQIVDGTWAGTWKRLPPHLQSQVPSTFTADPYQQALVAAQLIKGYEQRGYGSDPRLMYVAHWGGQDAADRVKKRMTSMDFDTALAEGVTESMSVGALSKTKRFRSMSMEDRVATGFKELKGLNRLTKYVPGMKPTNIPNQPVTGNMSTNTPVPEEVDNTVAKKASYAGGGTGDDIAITLARALTSKPTADPYSPTIVIEEGLDVPAWYQKSSPTGSSEILVGNPKLVSIPARGVFTIWLNENQALPLRVASAKENPDPVEIRLNVNLKSLSVQSRHVINKKPTRTGFHLTFWGMEPDILSGSGSTGTFLNQFGLSSIMSTMDGSGMAEELASKVRAQYANTKKVDVTVRAQGITNIGRNTKLEDIITSDIDGSPRNSLANWTKQYLGDFFGLTGVGPNEIDKDNIYSSDIASWSDQASRYKNEGGLWGLITSAGKKNFRSKYTIDKRLMTLMGPNAVDTFRVPAQDAFMELLQLFKNNGQIRFFNQKYDGYFNDKEQEGTQEWSETTGLSNFQGKARNNDVFARGVILFKYKGTTYFGYFKSFNFTLNANTPYTWDFNFTFQVMKTIKAAYVPNIRASYAPTGKE